MNETTGDNDTMTAPLGNSDATVDIKGSPKERLEAIQTYERVVDEMFFANLLTDAEYGRICKRVHAGKIAIVKSVKDAQGE